MKNVSNAFWAEMNRNRDFYCAAEITFSDGETVALGKDDFALSGNSVAESTGGSSFPLGMVIPKQITLSLNNYDDRWSEYDFQWAKIFLRTKYNLSDGRTETINIGNFTVITPESYGAIVEITAMDDCYRLDKEYGTNLTYPVSLGMAVRDSCSACGVSLLTTSFCNDDFVIQEKPENLTHRNFIGLCAMLAGGNARFDGNNRLAIIPYDFSRFGKNHMDGGIFDTGNPNIYETGNNIDGGGFSPWNSGGVYDGGQFGDRNGIHILFAFNSGFKVETDDVVITGIKLKSKDGGEVFFGKEGYVLSLENQLAAGKEENAAELIGEKIAGLRFRPFSGDHVSYPLAEFGDLALLIDRKQNIYQTVITDVGFSYFGFTSLKCTAESPIRNSSKYYGSETKAVVLAKKETEKQITDYDRAMKELSSILANSLGIYETYETLEDGSTVKYQHNKPTLAESMTIWKKTGDAFAVSTDGGKTWNAGIDSSGRAVVNVLAAIGLSASWLETGALVAKKGEKTVFLVDVETGRVEIVADVFSLSSGQTIESISEDAAKSAVESQTQQDILDRLTNGGEDDGIFLLDGKVYFSFSAARGGILKLGGAKNVNGELYLYDGNGKLVGKWDNESASFISASGGMSFVINGARISSISPDGEEYGSIAYSPENSSFGNGINISSQYGGIIFAINTSGRGLAPLWQKVFGIYSQEMKEQRGYEQNIVFHQKPYFESGLKTGRGIDAQSVNTETQTVRSWAEFERDVYMTGIGISSSGDPLVLKNPGTGKMAVYRQSSSSGRYKDIKRPMDEPDINRLYGITPVLAKYKKGYLADGDEREGMYYPMFIAEDIKEHIPEAAVHCGGDVEDWDARVMIPAMFQMIKSQKEMIDRLSEKVARLEVRVKGVG